MDPAGGLAFGEHVGHWRQVHQVNAADVLVKVPDMRVAEVRKFCKLDETGDSLIRVAMSQMNLSARAYHRTLKLARTIADLARSDQIQSGFRL